MYSFFLIKILFEKKIPKENLKDGAVNEEGEIENEKFDFSVYLVYQLSRSFNLFCRLFVTYGTFTTFESHNSFSSYQDAS